MSDTETIAYPFDADFAALVCHLARELGGPFTLCQVATMGKDSIRMSVSVSTALPKRDATA